MSTQIVYISARPGVLRDTMQHVRHFMPFVDEVVLVCPASQANRFTVPSSFRLTIVTDEDLLQEQTANIAGWDHQTRNYRLRTALPQIPEVADQFIMSDDDSRPLKPVASEFFLSDGRYHSYYFYDLTLWPSTRTEFDRGQNNTGQVLDYYGYSRYSFASHMPQIIDKAILAEAAQRFREPIKRYALCEWSIYFNFAHRHYPGRFHPPQPFQTLCWPKYPVSWPLVVRPGCYLFENFYPELYESGNLFDGVPQIPSPNEMEQINLEKIIRWHRLGVNRLESLPNPCDPWLRRSWLHRLGFYLARPIRRVYEFAALEERLALKQMEGYLQSLHEEIRCVANRNENNKKPSNEGD